MKPNFVLLNPPGSQRYLRDCYCSSIDKAYYYWHPLDFVLQSGFLDRAHNVVLLDAIVEKLDEKELLKKLRELRPIAVHSLTSYLSWREDRHTLAKIKQEIDAPLVVSGDLPRFQPLSFLQRAEFVDGILMDITTPHLAQWLETSEMPSNTSITHRQNGEIFAGKLPETEIFSYPLPRHDLFWARAYRFPFGVPEPYASVLTAHGCPYQCGYCNTGMVHFARRERDNLLEELSWLADRGVRGLLLRDATLNISAEVVERFCRLLLDNNWKFKWFCYARPDTLDERQVALMAEAGCRFVAFGIETGSQKILDEYKQGASLEQMIATLRACRKHGIETLGHIMFGLPTDTLETLAETNKLLRHIPLDFAAINTFEPRPGALLYGSDVTMARVENGENTFPTVDELAGRGLTPAVLAQWRRKMYRTFYLRLSFLLRRLWMMRSPEILKSYLRNGWRLLINMFSR